MISFFDHASAAVRRGWRHPRNFMLMVLVVTVGIGTVIGVFDIASAVLRGRLPYREPDRIVVADHALSGFLYDLETWQPHALLGTVFDAAAVFHVQTVNLHLGAASRRIVLASVTREFFRTLGIRLVGGSGSPAGEGLSQSLADDPAGVIISHRLWKALFGGSGDGPDHTLIMEIHPYRFRVLGIAPPGANFPSGADAWIRERRHSVLAVQQAGIAPFRAGAMGLLRPGVTRRAAEAAIRSWPGSSRWFGRHGPQGARLVPLREAIVGGLYPLSRFLSFVTTLFLAFTAITGVGILQVDLASRRSEFARRSSFGATPDVLWRSLCAETAAVIAPAVFGGLLVREAIVRVAAARLPVLRDAAIATTWVDVVLAVGVGILILLAMVAAAARELGLLAWKRKKLAATTAANDGLPPQDRTMAPPAQLVLATVIAIVAVAMGRGGYSALRIDPGVEPRDTFVIEVGLGLGEGLPAEAAQLHAHLSTMIERMEAAPGVAHAGVISIAPYRGYPAFNSGAFYSVAGAPPAQVREIRHTAARSMSPGAIPALGMKLLHGRNFGAGGAGVSDKGTVIVNRAFARQLGSWDKVLGGGVRFRSRAFPPHEIIGIVDDVHESDLLSDVMPTLYYSLEEFPRIDIDVVIRTSGRVAASDVLRIVDSSVRTVAPRAALAGFARFGDMVAAGGTLRRLSALYLLALATVGAVLVGLIIAAKSNAFVRSREHDIAVRIAVGATGASVVRYLALRQMPWMISAAVVGALLVFIGGRLVQHWSPVLDEFSSGTYAAGMCGVVAYVSMATLWSLWRAVSRIPAVLNTRPS